ncbi:MAG: hypothetical protein GY835_19190 [bacterium]|nr:hypothetical protein [bacterium]
MWFRSVLATCLLAILGVAGFVSAQELPPPEPKPKPRPERPAEPKPKPRPEQPAEPTQTTAPPETPTPPPALPGSLLIKVDAPCKIVVDGEDVATLAAGRVMKVPIGLGEHLVEAKSMEEEGVLWEKVISIEDNAQKFVPVMLAQTVRETKVARAAARAAEEALAETAAKAAKAVVKVAKAVAKAAMEKLRLSQPFTHEATGLMWTPTDSGDNRDRFGAGFYCRRLVFGGFEGWRLPTIAELISIYAPESGKPFKTVDGVDVCGTIMVGFKSPWRNAAYVWSSDQFCRNLTPEEIKTEQRKKRQERKRLKREIEQLKKVRKNPKADLDRLLLKITKSSLKRAKEPPRTTTCSYGAFEFYDGDVRKTSYDSEYRVLCVRPVSNPDE